MFHFLIDVQWHLIVVLICVFLVAIDIKHLTYIHEFSQYFVHHDYKALCKIRRLHEYPSFIITMLSVIGTFRNQFSPRQPWQGPRTRLGRRSRRPVSIETNYKCSDHWRDGGRIIPHTSACTGNILLRSCLLELSSMSYQCFLLFLTQKRPLKNCVLATNK